MSGTPLDVHDAATSLLVSHFLTETAARQSFFEDIAARLKPGGLLFNLDLCADRQAGGFPEALELWLGLMRHNGMPEEICTKWTQSFGQVFSVHGPTELETLIAASGFTPPASVFQASMMRGWVAAKEA